LRITLASWLALAGLQCWQTGIISLAAPLTGLICAPIVIGGLYPLALASVSLGLGDFALRPIGTTVTALIESLTRLALRAHLVWGVAGSAWFAAIPLASLACGLRRHPPALAALLGLALATRAAFTFTKDLQVAQLDVGQGDAALVTDALAGRSGLVDSGDGQALDAVGWLRLLARAGIAKIDWVLLTHLDADHSRGLFELARVVPVACVATSEAEARSERGLSYFNRAGALGIARLGLDECVPYPHFTVSRTKARTNANMTALLLPLRGGGFYLSAGDAEYDDEEEIGRWAAELAREEPSLRRGPVILKVSHHGSRTSSSPEFLKAIHPDVAWISSGVGNPYGHPCPEILGRFDALHIRVRRTDHEGELRYSSSLPPSTTNTSPVTQAESGPRK
jgi:competence protein ComEC